MKTQTAPAPELLDGNEYVELLETRLAVWTEDNPDSDRRFPPLLAWFVEDGDEQLVDPAVHNPDQFGPPDLTCVDCRRAGCGPTCTECGSGCQCECAPNG